MIDLRVFFFWPVVSAMVIALSPIARTCAQEAAAPRLSISTGSVSRDGHLKLVWEMESAEDKVILQQSSDEAFTSPRQLYSGPDNATVVSGLPNGTYYFRLRHHEGDWSAPVSVQVKHHSVVLALTLCVLGGMVFLSTAAVVVAGAKRFR